MLVLKRRSGQWLDIKNVENGQPIRIRVITNPDGTVNLVFDDAPRNYEINRPERKTNTEPTS